MNLAGIYGSEQYLINLASDLVKKLREMVFFSSGGINRRNRISVCRMLLALKDYTRPSAWALALISLDFIYTDVVNGQHCDFLPRERYSKIRNCRWF